MSIKDIILPGLFLRRQGKATIQWSDFTYLGSFEPPTSYVYSITGKGLSHRWIGGTLYLLGVHSQDGVYHYTPLADGSLKKTQPFNTQTSYINYGLGAITPLKKFNDAGDAVVDNDTNTANCWGFFWDETTQRFYGSMHHGYGEPGVSVVPSLYASTFNDVTHTGQCVGQWFVSAASQELPHQRPLVQCLRIPSAWAATYTPGRDMLLGFGWQGGNDMSVESNGGTRGATFGCAGWPTSEANFSVLNTPFQMLNQRYATAGFPQGSSETRPEPLLWAEGPAYGIIEHPNTTPASTHAWGVWIDTPTKHGILVHQHAVWGYWQGTIAASPTPTSLTFGVTNGAALQAIYDNWANQAGHYIILQTAGLGLRGTSAGKIESITDGVVTLTSDGWFKHYVSEDVYDAYTPVAGEDVCLGLCYPNSVGGWMQSDSRGYMSVYDPTAVAGQLVNDYASRQVTPVNSFLTDLDQSMPTDFWYWHDGMPYGMTYVAETKRLYLQVYLGRPGNQDPAIISVFQLND